MTAGERAALPFLAIAGMIFAVACHFAVFLVRRRSPPDQAACFVSLLAAHIQATGLVGWFLNNATSLPRLGHRAALPAAPDEHGPCVVCGLRSSP